MIYFCLYNDGLDVFFQSSSFKFISIASKPYIGFVSYPYCYFDVLQDEIVKNLNKYNITEEKLIQEYIKNYRSNVKVNLTSSFEDFKHKLDDIILLKEII